MQNPSVLPGIVLQIIAETTKEPWVTKRSRISAAIRNDQAETLFTLKESITCLRSFSSSTNTFSGVCNLNSYNLLFSTPRTERYRRSHSKLTTRSFGITASSLLFANDFMFTWWHLNFQNMLSQENYQLQVYACSSQSSNNERMKILVTNSCVMFQHQTQLTSTR